MSRFLILFSFCISGFILEGSGSDYSGSASSPRADQMAQLNSPFASDEPRLKSPFAFKEGMRTHMSRRTRGSTDTEGVIEQRYPDQQALICIGFDAEGHSIMKEQDFQVTHTYTMEAAIRRQEQDPAWQYAQKVLQQEGAQQALRLPMSQYRLEAALNQDQNGCMSGFSDKHKDIVREKLGGFYTKDWKEKLLSFYSHRGAMSGFTEENKIRILSALHAVQSKTEDSDLFLVTFLSHFDHGGEWLTWSEEKKVAITEAIHCQMPADIDQSILTEPTSGMEDLD